MEQRGVDEDGFTLIELLVVVVIIGILAAIAIPTMVRTRERAWAAAVQSDIRTAAIEIESTFIETGYYADASATRSLTGVASWDGVTWVDEQDFTPTAGVTTTVTATNGGLSYCIESVHINSDPATETFYLSTEGTLNQVAC